MTDYIEKVFAADGLLSQKIEGYEVRQGQIDMAEAAHDAFQSRSHLMAEGPTGTGKTFALAVPATKWAADTKQRVLFVTGNIALQEQYIRRDLPFLKTVLPWEFKAALVKGKSNFLCVDAVAKIRAGNIPKGMVDNELGDQLDTILEWEDEGNCDAAGGDKSALTWTPDPRVWASVSVGSEDCKSGKCEMREHCFADRHKIRAAAANVLVANYHLLYADINLRSETGGKVSVLPEYELVIMDEGHKAADIARDFFGISVSKYRISRAVMPLHKIKAGLTADSANAAAATLFMSVANYFGSSRYQDKLDEDHFVNAEPLLNWLHQAEGMFSRAEKNLAVPDRKEAQRLNVKRVKRLRKDLTDVMTLSDPDTVYYLEKRGKSVAMRSKLATPRTVLKPKLFNYHPVTVMSATMTTNGSFKYIARDLGVPSADEVVAESPFDYSKQAILITPSMPDPRSPGFYNAVAARFLEIVERMGGKTLGLFTSYKSLKIVQEALEKSDLGYNVLVQGTKPRTLLVDEFRANVSSVLLGTDSFWQGVDVKGESLSCVVIDRLPFATPNDPVMARIREENPNWFFEHCIPQSIIKLKQAVGRLIRSTDDRGAVVILDSRLTTKGYGKKLIRALPPMPMHTSLSALDKLAWK
jgi:ATP-dependent DNA helicase DinG